MATTSQDSDCNRSRGGVGSRRRARLAAASELFVLEGTLGVITPPAAQATTGVLGVPVTSDGSGYAAFSSTGEVHAFGSVVQRGNPTGFAGTIAGISVTADGQGYAAISSTGQVYAYGTVQYHGNPYDIFGAARGISVTANGTGYAVVTDQGQIHAYGPITYRGDYDDVLIQDQTQPDLRAARYVNWTYNGTGFWNVDQTVGWSSGLYTPVGLSTGHGRTLARAAGIHGPADQRPTKASCDQVPLSVVNWTYPTANDGTNSASFAQSFKASCTGGRAALTTINGGTPAVNASLGGPRS